MKKLIVILCAAVLLVSLGTVCALAAGGNREEVCPVRECAAETCPVVTEAPCAPEKPQRAFTDEDDDGVCDNREDNACEPSGNGVCGGEGTCDRKPLRDGNGRGNGNGYRHGRG